jgi:hypothetical protein
MFHADTHTDMMKITVASRNFVNVPRNDTSFAVLCVPTMRMKTTGLGSNFSVCQDLQFS